SAFLAPITPNSFAQKRAAARSAVTSLRMVDAAELEAKVIDVVGEQLGKEGAVKIDSTFIEDLDADSLDTIELIMKLEQEFAGEKAKRALEIPEEDAQKMMSVKDAVEYIKAHSN
ncbi:unnamed protein product, partial [Ascophyllum nodosum]